ncbi:MAG: ATP-binding protein [Hyphomonadaceae bacterium]
MISSLRWRLLAGAAAAIFVALALAWLAMTLLFERHLERRLSVELEQFGARLAAAVLLTPTGDLTINEPPPEPRFDTPASGLYWQASAGEAIVASRSLWDQSLARPNDAPSRAWRTRHGAGPYGQAVFLIEREIRPNAQGSAVLIQIAEDVRVLKSARDAFAQELAIFIALLWLVLSGAAWVQVGLGLRPLAGVRFELENMQDNPERRLTDARLSEIKPLVDAINALADAREIDLVKAKRRAADLAHGLKTPLAALAAQTRKAREFGASEAAAGLNHAIEAIQQTVDKELARSRVSSVRTSRPAASLALPSLVKVVNVLEHTEKGSAVSVDIRVPEAFALPLRQDDLHELFGPLLENAVRFARRLVRVSASATETGLLLEIEDDGVGLSDDALQTALHRGVRLDEAGAGQGLGLAIAVEIAEATGGTVSLNRSALGGLRVALAWPLPRAS